MVQPNEWLTSHRIHFLFESPLIWDVDYVISLRKRSRNKHSPIYWHQFSTTFLCGSDDFYNIGQHICSNRLAIDILNSLKKMCHKYRIVSKHGLRPLDYSHVTSNFITRLACYVNITIEKVVGRGHFIHVKIVKSIKWSNNSFTSMNHEYYYIPIALCLNLEAYVFHITSQLNAKTTPRYMSIPGIAVTMAPPTALAFFL